MTKNKKSDTEKDELKEEGENIETNKIICENNGNVQNFFSTRIKQIKISPEKSQLLIQVTTTNNQERPKNEHKDHKPPTNNHKRLQTTNK